MATPADDRLLEILDKWLKSLELHLRYSALDADSYAKVQPWPEHQRPTRWIVELATQKTMALRAQVEERIKMGDKTFSEALELMTFLANLVGSEHIERFIPLADPAAERELRRPAPPETVGDASSSTSTTITREFPVSITATREMPTFAAGKRRPHAPAPVSTANVARTERKVAHAKQPAKHAAPASAAAPAADAKSREAAHKHARDQVIADAARLVQWGRKWYELAELIARMADRPPLPEVRRILKENKPAIEKKAGRG